MTTEKKCKEKEISDLLPWYVTDNLTEGEKIRVERHLEECPVCKEELEKIKWISEGFYIGDSTNSAKHIDSRLLTIYSETKKELKKEVVQRIETHLSTCEQCQNELKKLNAVNQSLEPVEKATIFISFKQKINALINGVILKPAFAYILLLLLLYPAWLGLFRRDANQGVMSDPVNLNQLFVLRQNDQRASGKQLNEIDLKSTSGFFALSFVIPVNNLNSSKYKAVIVNSHNKLTWKSNKLTFIDEYGTAVIICPLKYFSGGKYTLTVIENTKSPDKIKTSYTFTFKIVTKD